MNWIDKTTQSIIQRCQVSIHMSSYEDRVWCDFLDINTAHVLLGRLWLYDLDVTSLGRSNTYEFKFNENKIVLKSVKPKSNIENNKKGTTTKKNNTPYYLMTKSHFSSESPIDGSTLRSRSSLSHLSLPLGIPPLPQLNHLHHICMSCMNIIQNKWQSTIITFSLLQSFTSGYRTSQLVMRCWLECTQRGFYSELCKSSIFDALHTRRMVPYKVLKKFGSIAYELDIPYDLGISLVFNVEDLTRYGTFTRPQWFSVHPLQSSLLRRSTTEEFVQSFPVRSQHSHRRHLSVANFSKPGRIDGNQYDLLFGLDYFPLCYLA